MSRRLSFRHSLSQLQKGILTGLLLCLILLFGIALGYCKNHIFSENGKFEDITDSIFRSEAASSSLNLHYTLANPQKYGIRQEKASFGTMKTDSSTCISECENYLKRLKNIRYSSLSEENQLTMDVLLLTLTAQTSLKDCWLLEEPLGPSLGIQAQLPVLLAEYSFNTSQDITDYLNLLLDTKSYFNSILLFEQKKSEAGYFMSDTTLDRILTQCSDFIRNPDQNYLLQSFSDRLKSFGRLSAKEQDVLISRHKKIILEHLIPAYEKLMTGLSRLRGTGKESRGLYHFPNGKTYYMYLLKSQTGTYASVDSIQRRLFSQLSNDCRQLSLLLRENPTLTSRLTSKENFPVTDPEKILTILQKKMAADFPKLQTSDYEIRYVPSSMEKYLSPAFYLTPPLDTGTPNVIYVNRSSTDSGLERFTTLAHEGFPGHLYQTLYFRQTDPSPIRYLLSCSGYVEGWATYTEAYACQYAASLLQDDTAASYTTASWLNRSCNLCIYSLLDLGIHYYGWNQRQASVFLKVFGISDEKLCGEIFQYIVETPGNYLKYYLGYLNFLDLKTEQQKKEGESFDVSKFHQRILEIGPVPFPVLKKYF